MRLVRWRVFAFARFLPLCLSVDRPFLGVRRRIFVAYVWSDHWRYTTPWGVGVCWRGRLYGRGIFCTLALHGQLLLTDPTGEFKMNDDETTDQQDAEATEPEQRATDGTGMIWVIAFAVLILAMVLAL
ncbi:MAG: hypothetical protein CMQ22_09075 [Gammaproteobacteria bacterium]|nr:hypothetical protein [Gammaproteobacteria bacterium]